MTDVPPASEAPRLVPRRQFVQVAAIGLAGLACPPFAGHASAETLGALARPAVLDVLGSADLVRALGRQYLTLAPAEHAIARLAHAILPDASALRPDQVRPALAVRVRDDFAAARTVTVQGWILSVTEARQCALFALHVG